MLRECWLGRPSPYESCVDRPSCSDGMYVLLGLAAIICAMTWSTEVPLLALRVPLGEVPVHVEAESAPWLPRPLLLVYVSPPNGAEFAMLANTIRFAFSSWSGCSSGERVQPVPEPEPVGIQYWAVPF